MWIKMISGVAGPKFAYSPGEQVDHEPRVEAERWIARGIAVAVEPSVAVIRAPEVAVIRRRRRNQVG